MNLTTDNWIPVVWQDGRAGKVSLLEVFQDGASIRDLAVRPHERIALMRLLICIAQAALDGPKDRPDWQTCRARLPGVAADYLAKWKHAFELFGDGQRFLQIFPKKVDTDEDGGGDVGKLNLMLAAGNNSTLFDNAGGTRRPFAESDVALNLLTYQNYSPLVGRGYKGRSPCMESNMLHTLVLGVSLAETLWLNLVTLEQVEIYVGKEAANGRPVWEVWPELLKGHEKTIKMATQTYLGRLCPVERAIWLFDGGSSMQLGNGLEYPEFREATASIVLNRKRDERVPLSVPPEKGIWRQLPSIVVKRHQEDSLIRGPLALQHQEEDKDAEIWSGALTSDGKAKLIDTVESAYRIPAKMFGDSGRQLFQSGVQRAEWKVVTLGRAIAACRRAMKDEIEGEFWKRGVKVKHKATSHYWTAIEQQVPQLLALVEDPAPLFRDSPGKENWGGTDWGKSLDRAARAAYDLACPHETPRQLKAYAVGLDVLFKTVEAPGDEKANEETEA